MLMLKCFLAARLAKFRKRQEIRQEKMQERKNRKARRTLNFLKAEPGSPCGTWGCGHERGDTKKGSGVQYRTRLEIG